jgi:hypothetical protein
LLNFIQVSVANDVLNADLVSMLQVAIPHDLLNADLVSMSACAGRSVWEAVTRLYALQQEQAGKVHVAALHLIAIGDRQAAIATYR